MDEQRAFDWAIMHSVKLECVYDRRLEQWTWYAAVVGEAGAVLRVVAVDSAVLGVVGTAEALVRRLAEAFETWDVATAIRSLDGLKRR